MIVDRSVTHTLSAYGGDGLQPRPRSLREELGDLWASCGIASEWEPLRAVLLHRPGDELLASADPNAVNMLAPLDLAPIRITQDNVYLGA